MGMNRTALALVATAVILIGAGATIDVWIWSRPPRWMESHAEAALPFAAPTALVAIATFLVGFLLAAAMILRERRKRTNGQE